MNKTLKIAQREYIETAKTKTFLMGLVMVPFIIAGIIFFTSRVSRRKPGSRPPVSVAVTDLSGDVYAEAQKKFYEYNKANRDRKIQITQDPNASEREAKQRLRQGHRYAYVFLDEDILAGSGRMQILTYEPKADPAVVWVIEKLFQEAIESKRSEGVEIPREVSELREVAVERVVIPADAEDESSRGRGMGAAMMMVPFFFMYLMFMGMVGTGQHLISSVIEEKNSRVIEVLLSAVSPFQLMAGKILGLAAIGLTVVTLWAGAAYMAARWQGLNIEVTGQLMIYFVIYYILGFLLFSSILAGLGSICNTIKETQGLMMPIMMVLILPLLAWFKLVQDPGGTLARTLTFVPPLTPMVMILRLSSGANIGIGEIAASLALLAATVVAAIWAAAKVFRTGILMYGKRPALREVFKWLKQG